MTGKPPPHEPPNRPPSEEELLGQCLDRPESEQVEELERLCRLHPEAAAGLRHRYALLASHGMVSLPATPGMRFGDYRLIEELGRGGMGVVYLAEHVELERRVALKMLSPALLDSERAAARFQREIAALAKVDHPGVCPIYEAGEANGQPFIAMRFVPGRTLADVFEEARANGRPLPTEQVVDWLRQAAEAVDCVHQLGLVHRDLKPANLILGDDDRIVVLDFGLARQLDSLEPALTMSHDPIGTPTYMSPEQVRGGPVDARTDVYALGALLFEALTLSPPFAGVQRDEVFHRVANEAPPRLRLLRRDAPRDLELVVSVCLDKESRHRYASAGALAADLECVQKKQPIRARPLPAMLRLWRWSQRNRVASVVMLFLAALTVTSTFFLLRIAGADRAMRGRNLVLASIDASRGDSDLAALFAEAAYRLDPSVESLDFLRDSLFKVHEVSSGRYPIEDYPDEGAFFTHMVRVDNEHVLTFGEDPWCALWKGDGLDFVKRIELKGKAMAAAVAPNGTIAVSTWDQRNVQFFTPAGEPADIDDLGITGGLSMVWLDDEQLVLGGGSGEVHVCNVRNGTRRKLPLRGLPRKFVHVVLSADRRTMLLGTLNHAYVCTVTDGVPGDVQALEGFEGVGWLWAIDVTPDGSKLVVAAGQFAGRSRNMGKTPKALTRLYERRDDGYHQLGPDITDHGAVAMCAQLSPDGTRLAIGTQTGRVCVYDAVKNPGSLLRANETLDGTMVPSMSWSPDSDRVAASTFNRTTHVFDRNGNPRQLMRCLGVFASEFSSDGRHLHLLTLGVEGVQRQRLDHPERLLGHAGGLFFARPMGGNRVATGGKDGRTLVWGPDGGPPRKLSAEDQKGWLNSGAVAANGDILTAGRHYVRRYWRDGTQDENPERSTEKFSIALCVLPLPDRRIVVGTEKNVSILAPDLQTPAVSFDDHGAKAIDVTPDGRWLVVGGRQDHRLRVFELSDPPVLTTSFKIHTTFLLRAAAISDDGKVVVGGGGDGVLHWFDVETGEHRHWRAHGTVMNDADIAADGRIVTASSDRTAAVWDPRGNRLAWLKGHELGLWSARFMTPDGHHVVTAGEDGKALIWPLRAADVLKLARRDLHPKHRAAELEAKRDLVGDLLDRR